jgi:hypothetical protein
MAFVLDASVAISWCFPGDPAEDSNENGSLSNRSASISGCPVVAVVLVKAGS